MPPPFRPSDLASTESWHLPVHLQRLSEVVLLSALFIAVLRSILVARTTRRMTSPDLSQNDLAISQEKKLPFHQRKDSYQEEGLNKSSEKMESPGDGVGKKPMLVERHDSYIRLPPLDQAPNQYLQSLQQETLRPTLSPIYPWISPPQTLPGPYDAPYFPVPLPTVRSEELSQAKEQSPAIKTEPVSDNVPEELETISYTRRISTPSTPDHESLLEGAVTVSNKGWRRTQWTVTAG